MCSWFDVTGCEISTPQAAASKTGERQVHQRANRPCRQTKMNISLFCKGYSERRLSAACAQNKEEQLQPSKFQHNNKDGRNETETCIFK